MVRGLFLGFAFATAAQFPPADARIETPVRAHLLDAPTSSRVHRVVSSDRAAHALGGFWSAGAGYAVATHRDWDPGERRLAALATAATASVAKEAFDAWVQDEDFSTGDLVADGLGAAAFIAIVALAGP